MIEINAILQLNEEMPTTCNSFHLAEGPGGFIEAFSKLRNNLKSYVGNEDLRENLSEILDNIESAVTLKVGKEGSFDRRCIITGQVREKC